MPKSPEEHKLEKQDKKTEKEIETPEKEEKAAEDLKEPEQSEEIKGEEAEKIESVRKKIFEVSDKEDEMNEEIELLQKFRFPRRFESPPIDLSGEEKELILNTAIETKENLKDNYQEGFGVFPSADRKGIFHEQVWTRDFAHAAGNYFAAENPQALADSFETIFRH